MSCQETHILFDWRCPHQLSEKLYKEGNALSFLAIFTLFSEGFFFVVSHQAQLGLNKISWRDPSAPGSCRSILCHQLGWERPASSLFLSGSSATLNSMVTPQLYANGIKYSLLQVSIMTKHSLFLFSNWESF